MNTYRLVIKAHKDHGQPLFGDGYTEIHKRLNPLKEVIDISSLICNCDSYKVIESETRKSKPGSMNHPELWFDIVTKVDLTSVLNEWFCKDIITPYPPGALLYWTKLS